MQKIICADALTALKSLADDSVDIGVTSPPYNKGENKKGWLVKNIQYQNSSDKLDECDYQNQQIAVLNELYRLIKPGGSFFYNHKIRYEQGELLHPLYWLSQTHWTLKQEIVWDRKLAANIRGWRFWQVEERIYWLYKPLNNKNDKKANKKIGKELLSKHAKLSSIWRFSPETKNPHPAPFPLTLPLRAIYGVMDNQKGIVIDPYVGSGSTLVAAKLLGHHYIGIDIAPFYVEMAKTRLKNYQSEQAIWLKEKQQHTLKDTFADKKKQNRHIGRFAPKKNSKQHYLIKLL